MFRYVLLFALLFTLFFRPTAIHGQAPLPDWIEDKRLSQEKANEYAALIEENRKKGFAIVLMPIIRKDPWDVKIYVTSWTNETVAGSSMLVESKRAFRVGKPDQFYEMIFVNPGRFVMRGTFYSAGETTPPVIKPGVPTNKGLGLITFKYGERLAREISGWVWQPGKYRDKYVLKQECTSVFLDGRCATSENVSVNEPIQYEFPSYKPQYSYNLRGTTDVYVAANKPIAEFEVRAGEIILIDSIFAELPYYYYDEKQCYKLDEEGKTISCELTEFRIQHVPAKIEELRKIIAKPSGKQSGYPISTRDPLYPNKILAKTLEPIQYREVKINAKPTDDGWSKVGQTYVMEK